MKSKKVIRLEKKVKKTASLVELSKLNENDRKKTDSANENLPNPKRLCIEHLQSENAPKKPVLEGDEYLKLKADLKARKKELKLRPRLWLRDVGSSASLKEDIESRVPLFLSDVQHLIMYSQLAQHAPYSPARWCQLEKPNRLKRTVVVIVDNISMYDFVSNETAMPFIAKNFQHKLEVFSSRSYDRNIIQDLLMIPLTGTQYRTYQSKYNTIQEAVENNSDLFDIVQNIFHIEHAKIEMVKESSNCDEFSRTDLLLSGWQMVEENFPLPIKGLMERKYKGYVTTKDEYKMVTPHSPMFGVDCEMCNTSIGDNELTRVSIVDESHKVVYETLVKPPNKIVDYLTRFSGITAKMMKDVTKTLEDVQNDLRKILPPDAILVGQSVSMDLHALKIFHPYIIDTSIIYNLSGQRSRKSKLQLLTATFLNEAIQQSHKGHCPTEDSLASLKLVQHKLTKNVHYGDAVMSNVQSDFVRYPDMANTTFATNMLRAVTKYDKTALVCSTKSKLDLYRKWTFKDHEDEDGAKAWVKFYEVESDDVVISGLSECGGDYSLSIGHIQCKECNDEEYRRIDGEIKGICESFEGPSLYVIVFGGPKDGNSSNGSAFLNIA